MKAPPVEHLNEPITAVARRNVATLRDGSSVGEALEMIRARGESLGEKVVYFYVVDEDDRLVGVLPTRRLLTSAPQVLLRDIMVRKVLSIPQTATILQGCEAFVMHKLLAFPVVDRDKRIVGIVDVGLLADEAFDLAEREETDALFESIGFRISQVRDASPWKAFRYRFPWLLATIASGTICAVLAGFFEMTLAQSLILAFFLTLVLGLGESVSIQSVAVTIQILRAVEPSFAWYVRAFVREAGTALLLGAACGGLVGLIAWIWRGTGLDGLVIGGSIFLSLCMACFLGLTVPTVLHALKLDPKVAAGPLTLALTDICTLLFYFGVASFFLSGGLIPTAGEAE
jgi:magnesium transporter